MGLLSRYTADLYNEKIYDITERGSERLDYLRDSVLERMEMDRMNEFPANIKRCRVDRQKEKIASVVSDRMNEILEIIQSEQHKKE
ncbi:MAG: hypothetical protein ACXABF_16950 [Candidatus Thorarchaeota archaeon]|jgi:DNA-binding PadR family transcriptional regulator